MLENRLDISTLDIKVIFIQALRVFKQNPRLFISFGLVCGLAAVSDQILYKVARVQSEGWTFVLHLLITSWASVGLIEAARRYYQGKSCSLTEVLPIIRRSYTAYIVVAATYFLLVFGGILLFIIPGIYCSTVFILADVIVVLERKDYLESFRRSLSLVKNFFWQVLLYSLISSSLMLFPVVLAKLPVWASMKVGHTLNICALVFLVPYLTIAQVGLYWVLVKQGHVVREESHDDG